MGPGVAKTTMYQKMRITKNLNLTLTTKQYMFKEELSNVERQKMVQNTTLFLGEIIYDKSDFPDGSV